MPVIVKFHAAVERSLDIVVLVSPGLAGDCSADILVIVTESLAADRPGDILVIIEFPARLRTSSWP